MRGGEPRENEEKGPWVRVRLERLFQPWEMRGPRVGRQAQMMPRNCSAAVQLARGIAVSIQGKLVDEERSGRRAKGRRRGNRQEKSKKLTLGKVTMRIIVVAIVL